MTAVLHPPRRVSLDPVHHRPDLIHPLKATVPRVPQEPEVPARAHDPRYFRHGPLGVEPVKGLRHDHRVDRLIGERQCFGPPGEHRHPWQPFVQPVAHRGHWLDRDQVGPRSREQFGQLAGSGGQVDDLPARPDAESLDQPVDGVQRIRRPGPVIRVRFGTEADSRDLMYLAHLALRSVHALSDDLVEICEYRLVPRPVDPAERGPAPQPAIQVGGVAGDGGGRFGVRAGTGDLDSLVVTGPAAIWVHADETTNLYHPNITRIGSYDSQGHALVP